MGKWLRALLAVTTALLLLAAITVAVLIGLNAECNGAADDCPRSDAYRGTLLAMPIATAALLLGGAAWSVRRRSARPLVLAEAGVLGFVAIVGAVLGGAGIGTVVLLVLALVVGRAALRRPRAGPT